MVVLSQPQKVRASTSLEHPSEPLPPPSYDASQTAVPDSHGPPSPPSSSSLPPPQEQQSPPALIISPSSDSSSPSKPINHIFLIKTRGAVGGRWRIDPSLPLAPPLLGSFTQQTDPNTTGKTVYLKTLNGPIDADVTLIPSVPQSEDPGPLKAKGNRAALLEARTMNGAINFNLHDGPEDSSKKRVPIKLKASSANGSVYITIPRSFQGIINTHCNLGRTKISDEIKAQIQFSQTESRNRRMVVGSFDSQSAAEESPGQAAEWDGDEVTAETDIGNIRISYDDENLPPMPSADTVLPKMWGSLVLEPLFLASRITEGVFGLGRPR